MKKIILIAISFLMCLHTLSAREKAVKIIKFGNPITSSGLLYADTNTLYTESSTYGFLPSGELEMNSQPSKKSWVASHKPFYFNVNLAEGQYKIVLTLGGAPEATSTTIKAESRRLMLDGVMVPAGKTINKTIVVDIRTPRISDTQNIKLKSREKDYLNWDNKLTLEFTGDYPCVSAIEIYKADHLPTIFLAGNSTVTDQNGEPYASWGQMLPFLLKPNIVVANLAESGETLRSFKGAYRLAKITSRMKKNDYLFIEFGHNDQKPGSSHVEPFTTYKDELKYFIAEARKKGGIPVLVTSTQRRRFGDNAKIINTLGDYPEAVRQTGIEMGVDVIDLNEMSTVFYETLGPELSKKALVHYPANSFPGQTKALADDTHFSPYGALQLAKMVANDIANAKTGLKKHLRNRKFHFNPIQPDDPFTFKWYDSPAVDTVKPNGN